MPPPYDLLERMRRSKGGWRPIDLERLYLGFGFQLKEGGKHRLYFHSRDRSLMATVRRADPLPTGYVVQAVRLVDVLIEMEESDARSKDV